jgi:hypothetical protein
MQEINITTIVGCPNLCSYCHQEVFFNYKNDVKILTLDNFKLMLKNINKHIVLNFVSFSENFLNPYFINVLILKFQYILNYNIYKTYNHFH